MNKLHAEWQARWREILGESTTNMPEDASNDFALHINVWNLDVDRQKKCFSLFPNGLNMLERANYIRDIDPKHINIESSKLIGYLEKINDSVENVLAKTQEKGAILWNEGKKKCAEPVVYRGNFEYGQKLLRQGCSPTEPLDEILSDIFATKFGEEGLATYKYLFEPFYNIANDNRIQSSIYWAALEDEYAENPYEKVIELYSMKSQGRWNENTNELFVFQEE